MKSIDDLGRLDRDAFVAEVGFAFESSPWVAEAAWEERPFASAAELHAAMVRAVERSPEERQLALIRAHPELGGGDDLTPASAAEQAFVRLDRLDGHKRGRFREATAAYREKFGFPFVVCVREHGPESILANAEARLGRSPEEERATALEEIAKIAALRLEDRLGPGDGALPGIDYEISYGKASVPVYRHYATPLTGLPEVPESAVRGRDNVLFANEITVEVFGDNFLPAYTRGDNSSVVATDSMKNFILSEAGAYEGATPEGYLARLGEGFLERYEQMQSVRVSSRELPFDAAQVPGAGGFEPSEVLRRRGAGEHSVASLGFIRSDGGAALVEQRSGRVGIELLKVKGSAFTHFVRDEYTTLPERSDRPLFIRLDVHWTPRYPGDSLGDVPERYVAGEQVHDVCAAVFDDLVSESIQQLVHAMGERLLERYPQLGSVELAAANMTRDPHDDERKVFVPPFPAFGTITLTMRRSG
jgi:urate oxidase / 2-oxo-4-hydroxy-4-carboxy-5-ureidoimidazoline decarboxylase